MSTRAPTAADLARRAVRIALEQLRTAHPAQVLKWDAAAQRVDVQPLLLDVYEEEGGARATQKLPVITNVPVVFPGAGGFRLTFPVKVGDTVLLVFAERSLDTWLAKGGLADPVDVRTHHLSDAIAIPGLRSFADPLGPVRADACTLGEDDGAQVVVKDGTVHLGEHDANQALLLGTSYRAAQAQLHALVKAALTAAAAGFTDLAAKLPTTAGTATPAAAACTAAAAAVDAFEAGQHLSGVSFTK